MFVHRYHLPYYQQVAVFFWPILFFELWRVDRWQAETGRRAFVTPDKYGRAWVPYFEGMSLKPHLNGMDTALYKPADVQALCPSRLALMCIEASLSNRPQVQPSGARPPAFSLPDTFGHKIILYGPWSPAPG